MVALPAERFKIPSFFRWWNPVEEVERGPISAEAWHYLRGLALLVAKLTQKRRHLQLSHVGKGDQQQRRQQEQTNNKQTHKQTNKQTNRQTDKQTNKQTKKERTKERKKERKNKITLQEDEQMGQLHCFRLFLVW